MGVESASEATMAVRVSQVDEADPLEIFNKRAKERTQRALAELGVVHA